MAEVLGEAGDTELWRMSKQGKSSTAGRGRLDVGSKC